MKRLWWCYLVVFIASGCSLVLEILAGRIVAPYVGVSIYTWTSVIGVVLAGISAGNFTGGVVADRWAGRTTLALVLAAGAACSFAILPLIGLTTSTLFGTAVPLVGKILIMTAVIFFPASFILGMVSPVMIKLALPDLARAGGVVGRIYAASTLGSIVGTYLTGFVLIASFGTRHIVLAVGVVLLAMAAIIAFSVRRRETALGVAALIGLGIGGSIAVSLNASVSGWLQERSRTFAAPCTVETDYYCIRVESVDLDGRHLRQLVLDHLIHSFNDLQDPTYIHYGYERVYAEITDYVAQQHPDFHALHLGGGGYTIPRYIEADYPGAADDVFEIDPEVTAVARQYMGLSATSRVRTFNMDARLGVQSVAQRGQYQLVFGDAFNDLSVPYHLTTQEFDRELSTVMAPDGIYLANIIDKIQGGRFMASTVRTLRTVFPFVYVLNDFESWYSPAPNTYVVAASRAPLDVQRLATVRGQGPGGSVETKMMPSARMEEWLADSQPLLLTDDYVPVDTLLAPLFLERGA